MSANGGMVSDYTALLSGDYWNGGAMGRSAIVTYSFGSRAESYLGQRFDTTALSSWRALNASQEAEARNAIAQVEALSGLTFYEVAEGGDITLQMMNFSLIPKNAGGFAYYPNVQTGFSGFASDLAGDIFLDSQDYGAGRSVLDVTLHELGHAVGLKHPFGGSPTLAPHLDTSSQTIMSYDGPLQTGFGPLDIQALHAIYGNAANKGSHLSGHGFDAVTETVHQIGTAAGDEIIGTRVSDHMSGGGGDDVLFAGAGADTVFGGSGNDKLSGFDGDDVLLAGAGDDTAYGGDGDDTMYMGEGDDSVTEFSSSASNDVIGGGGGNDRLFAGGGADTVFGGVSSVTSSGADYISAADGADLIFGGRGVAAFENDTLFGGTGDDTFYSGIGDDRTSGGTGADKIYGGAGNDTVFAGAGNDISWGGAGNDYIDVGAGVDIVGFTAGSGVDRVVGFSTADDRVWLTGTTRSFTSFSDVQAATSGTSSAVIDLGGGASVTLSGVSAASLGADDFIF